MRWLVVMSAARVKVWRVSHERLHTQGLDPLRSDADVSLLLGQGRVRLDESV